MHELLIKIAREIFSVCVTNTVAIVTALVIAHSIDSRIHAAHAAEFNPRTTLTTQALTCKRACLVARAELLFSSPRPANVRSADARIRARRR